MISDFRKFFMKDNFMSLAIAVVLGAAVGKVVQAIVDDFIMPIIAAAAPGGGWKEATLDIGSVKLGVGDFASVLINFIIIAFVVWRISRLLPEPPAPLPGRSCQYCRMTVDDAATRCPHCTSEI
ncbi:MAG: MscL family protein [Gemmatimonadaceae bacterium]